MADPESPIVSPAHPRPSSPHPCPARRLAPSSAGLRWLARSLLLGRITSAAFGVQFDVHIDADSLERSEAGILFQFESPGGTATDFEVWQSPTLGPASPWQKAPASSVEAITEGRYRALAPAPSGPATFYRVLRTGFPPPAPGPVFNEVMSDNATAQTTSDGRRLDWIELFNPHEDAVALDGLALVPGGPEATPWFLPGGLLQPGAFLLIHASGTPGTAPVPGGVLAPFGLSNQGETLRLVDAFGRELDQVDVPPLGPDEAIGRSPDGAARWAFLSRGQSTPGTPNPEVGAGNGVVVAPATFSPPGGFHPAPVTLALTTRHPGGVVRYTLDGSPPSVTSPEAPLVLPIEETRVVRATVFDAQGNASEELARTYFIGPRRHPGLAVLSIAGPPSHFTFRDGYLFGMGSRVLNSRGEVLQNYPFSGSNAWLDREAEVSLEFLEPDGTAAFRQRAGIKVYGGWGSRGYPQKSLAVLARREYGAGSFRHRIFPGSDIDTFESFVLRNSGNDNQSTHQIPPRPPITAFGETRSYGSYFVNGTFTLMRDALEQSLLLEHTRLDHQDYRPAVVYLNGQYWGLYNLREKLSEHHVLAHHELPAGSIDLIEGYGDVRAGDAIAYRALRDFVNTRNLALVTNYQHVADTWLEIDNFIDYNLAVLYFQNFDIGNIKCWRPRTPHGRFRWMVYDQDYGFGLWPAEIYEPAMARDYADYANMFRFATAGTGTSNGWPNAGGRTLLLRRLLANPGFRDRLIRRLTDLLNTAFREDRVAARIDAMASVLRPEIADHLQRWSWDELSRQGYAAPYQPEHAPFTQATWETNLLVLHRFARTRPAQVREQCATHFSLRGGQGTLRLEVRPAGAGGIRLNSLLLTNAAWEGRYFSDLPNDLRAVPQPGFRVRGWTSPDGFLPSTVARTTVAPDTTRTWVAEFEPLPTPPDPLPAPAANLRLTEINYHSADDRDAGDWVEIHNPGSTPVDLDGWVLRDQQDDPGLSCVLPAFQLGPGGSCVVARSVVKFQWIHPLAPDPIAAFDFGLGNDSDTLRLIDPSGIEVERVPYRDDAPWPTEADGGGRTLQRRLEGEDPTLATSWTASPTPGGTPGQYP